MPVENSPCHGNGEHCCYVPGLTNPEFGEGVCPFLVQNVIPGRRWACGLLVDKGSWQAVHKSKEYQTVVRPVWQGNDPPVADCGDWGPGTNQCCFKDS